MSSTDAIRLILALLLGAAMTWSVSNGYDDPRPMDGTQAEKERYHPMLAATLLPNFYVMLLALSCIAGDRIMPLRTVIGISFALFVQISIYDLLLLALLPVLRRHISARTCALLWLLPTYLYLMFNTAFRTGAPLWVLRLNGSWFRILGALWAAGFAGVILWKTIEHFCFRRRILKNARPAADPAVLEIWQSEIADAGIHKVRFRLVISPEVSAPLTIGLFRRTMRVALPERNYTPEELHLIFRHELVHICRADSMAKFFLVFCTAMCWFNPLMWRAMRLSADDMELSCDETVLLDADDETRRQYAALLLSAARDGRGYTTCLSAAASSMRYRLQSVVKPAKRHSGALLAGVLMTALLLTGGFTALAYDARTGAEVLFSGAEDVSFENVSLESADERRRTAICVDDAALRDYLSGLEMDALTGLYTFDGPERRLSCYYETDGGWISVELGGNMARVNSPFENSSKDTFYYLPDGLNWAYLDSIVLDPKLEVALTDGAEYPGHWDLSASPDRLFAVDGGTERQVYDSGITEYETPSGVYGPEPVQAVLTFRYLLTAPLRVEYEKWKINGVQRRTVTWNAGEGAYLLPLPDYGARYYVYAEFAAPDGTVYRAEYRFDIGE